MPRIFSVISVVALFFGCSSECIAEEPSLDDLLKEYKALGLPLPPKEAKLVRFVLSNRGLHFRQVNSKQEYGLAFLLKPETDTENALILGGTLQWRPKWKIHPQEVKPDAKVGELAGWYGYLPLAIQCHERGWNELARRLLKLSDENNRKPYWFGGIGPFVENTEPIQKQLIMLGWSYWSHRVTEPDIDRAPVAKRLHQIIKLDKEIATESDLAMLKSLDAALVPSKAKPGSVAALIDDLINYCPDELGRDIRYERIAKLGFEAVPELIAHLDDDRLTRCSAIFSNNPLFGFQYWDRVGDVVTDLLATLSELNHEEHQRLKKAVVEKWWESARKVGEEAYLLEHVLPSQEQRDQEFVFVNFGIASVIGHKYPKKLPSIYREILEKWPDHSIKLSDIVMSAALPVKEKVELFTLEARHKDFHHRYCGLVHLSELDKQLFVNLLTASIEDLPRDVSYYFSCDEVSVAHLVMRTDDSRPWQALEKAVRQASLGLKMELLDFSDVSSTDLRQRSKRLRLLMPYLDDATVRDDSSDKRFDGSSAGFAYHKIEVRNFVAMEIAPLVGIEARTGLERTADEWAKFRNHVREAAKRELAKEKKP